MYWRSDGEIAQLRGRERGVKSLETEVDGSYGTLLELCRSETIEGTCIATVIEDCTKALNIAFILEKCELLPASCMLPSPQEHERATLSEFRFRFRLARNGK